MLQEGCAEPVVRGCRERHHKQISEEGAWYKRLRTKYVICSPHPRSISKEFYRKYQAYKDKFSERMMLLL